MDDQSMEYDLSEFEEEFDDEFEIEACGSECVLLGAYQRARETGSTRSGDAGRFAGQRCLTAARLGRRFEAADSPIRVRIGSFRSRCLPQRDGSDTSGAPQLRSNCLSNQSPRGLAPDPGQVAASMRRVVNTSANRSCEATAKLTNPRADRRWCWVEYLPSRDGI